MSTQKKTKLKRIIPVREVGKPIDQKQLRPSQILFQQAKEEIAKENLGRPNIEISDARDSQSRTPVNTNLGRPNIEISDALTPEIESRASEKKPISDALTPEMKISDARDSQKTVRKSYDSKYEKSRVKVSSRDRMSLRPNIDVGKRIRVFCVEHKLELTEFFEIAAVSFIDNLGRPSFQISDALTSHDDRRLMITWKTKGHIINLHLRYTSFLNAKTKWTVNDDEKAHRLNEVDSRIIELGIIQTQFQKGFKGKINSFSYYLNEIDNFIALEMSGEVLETMLKINRRRWQQMTKKDLDYTEFDESTA